MARHAREDQEVEGNMKDLLQGTAQAEGGECKIPVTTSARTTLPLVLGHERGAAIEQERQGVRAGDD